MTRDPYAVVRQRIRRSETVIDPSEALRAAGGEVLRRSCDTLAEHAKPAGRSTETTGREGENSS